MENEEYLRVVKQHSNRLYLIALSYTKSHYDAEDIVQEVFIKLWKRDAGFNDEEHLRKWLTVACINKSKDYLRTSFFRHTTILEEANELYYFNSNESRDLFNAVMKLPYKDRSVIHLFYYEDYSVNEIADLLSIKESAVKTRLHRARLKLKNILGDEWINEQ